MNGALPAWLSRALAVAILLTLLSLLWGIVVGPAIGATVGRLADIEGTEQAIAGMRMLTSRQDELAQRLAELEVHPVWGSLLDTGLTESAALATLQREFRELAQRAGVVVDTMQPLPAVERHGLRRSGMAVQLDASIEQLSRLLREIDLNRHFFELDDVTIAAPIVQDSHQNPVLKLRASLFAYSPLEASP